MAVRLSICVSRLHISILEGVSSQALSKKHKVSVKELLELR